GAKPSTGSIALQCEGSLVHFRRIRLRKLPVVAPEKNGDVVPKNDTAAACSDWVTLGAPSLPRSSGSERGSRATVRRHSKVTATVSRNRLP
ncbi:MAG: hypothetical protein WCO86_18805, partial [Planctomycetota bacterium]